MTTCPLLFATYATNLSRRLLPLESSPFSLVLFRKNNWDLGRQILEVIGTTQECLHNIKIKNSKALILKLDLKKAFDYIDWDEFRLILVQIGFSQLMIRWILGYVVSTNLSILVNGEPSPFFRIDKGLRQGCPLLHFFLFW